MNKNIHMIEPSVIYSKKKRLFDTYHQTEKIHFAVLFVLVSVSGIIHSLYISGEIIPWWDEIQLWYQALSGNRSGAAQEAPLTAWLTRGVMYIAGSRSIVIPRGLQAFFATCSIIGIYLLGKSVLNKNVGLLAATIFTGNALRMSWGIEARPYGLFLFLIIIILYSFFSFWFRSPSLFKLILYLNGVLFGCMAHLLTLQVICVLLLFAGIQTFYRFCNGCRELKPFLQISIVTVAGGIFGLLWIEDLHSTLGVIENGPGATFLRFSWVVLAHLSDLSAKPPHTDYYFSCIAILYITLFASGICLLVRYKGFSEGAVLAALMVCLLLILYQSIGPKLSWDRAHRYFIHLLPILIVTVSSGALLLKRLSRSLSQILVILLIGISILNCWKQISIAASYKNEVPGFETTMKGIEQYSDQLQGVLITETITKYGDESIRGVVRYWLASKHSLPLYLIRRNLSEKNMVNRVEMERDLLKIGSIPVLSSEPVPLNPGFYGFFRTRRSRMGMSCSELGLIKAPHMNSAICIYE